MLAWLQKCTPDYLRLSDVSTISTFSNWKWTGFVLDFRLCQGEVSHTSNYDQITGGSVCVRLVLVTLRLLTQHSAATARAAGGCAVCCHQAECYIYTRA